MTVVVLDFVHWFGLVRAYRSCGFSYYRKQSFSECFPFRTDNLLQHLLPPVAKLGIKVGLRLIGSVKTGSIYDGTCVISADEVDILVMFDAYQVNITSCRK